MLEQLLKKKKEQFLLTSCKDTVLYNQSVAVWRSYIYTSEIITQGSATDHPTTLRPRGVNS